jgi:hypothetical protein
MPYPTTVIYVRNPEQVPACEHWVIIKGSSYTTESVGEWAPGHGYPASTEHYIEYIAYLNKEEFEAAFAKELLSTKGFMSTPVRAIHVHPMTAKTTVTLYD